MEKKSSVRIAFTGDISFSKYFTDVWKNDFIDDGLKSWLRDTDHVVANVECAVTEGEFEKSPFLQHASPPAALRCIAEVGGDLWTLANNHTMDCGLPGLLDTRAAAASYGCRTFGAGENVDDAIKPVCLEEAGGIGIFSVVWNIGKVAATETTPGCCLWTDKERIRENIRKIKEKNRWCIVVSHAGEEFAHIPMPIVQKRYREYLKMGADIVIGHHPHVVQNYEQVGSKIIFYSLGNFIFDTDYQRLQKNTDRGVLVKLELTEQGFTWTHQGVKINRADHRILPAEAPGIFRNVTHLQQILIWPFNTKHFWRNHFVARSHLKPALRTGTKKDWDDLNTEKYGRWPARQLRIGPVLYHLGYWRLAPREVRDYIKACTVDEPK